MTNFLELYLKYTEGFESPTSFFRWSAIATVAATLRDNCYRKMGGDDDRLYPNLYVLTLADSSMHRKAKPTGIAGDLVAAVGNTKLVRGRTSIQALLDTYRYLRP